MERQLVRDIPNYVDKELCLAGWVHRIRELGSISFVLLRDRSGIAQLVFESPPELRLESVIEIRGRVQVSEKAMAGVEVLVQNCTCVAEAAANLPFPVNNTESQAGIDAILDNRIISLRNPKILNIFRVQSEIINSFQSYLRSQDFTEIKTSKLIESGTEGGTGIFALQYFEREVYLAQSPQFYKQAMIASGLERVFEVAPVYRAEKHDTTRHLNEYVSLDIEIAFIKDEQDLMDIECEILSKIVENLTDNCMEILEQYNMKLPHPDQIRSIPRISYDHAREIITKRGNKKFFEINPEGERLLCDWAKEEKGIDAVFVHSFPLRKRPFYTYPDGQRTGSFDLLFRGIEITTGGRRIQDYAMIRESIARFGLRESDLASYLDIFKYGCPPHGGFAIGLERLTQQMLGLSNVKEASLFPRDRKRTTP